ncbi:MAG: hypothetical protein FWD77_01575 [Betaproteobacteria bacterium]|nr:hypothetical protein [Betaproteobacteria bacterium]
MATQIEIARHLDMSVTRLKETLPRLEVADSSNLDAVRIAYIRHLRSMAAGRGGENQVRLTEAKTRESELKGDQIEMNMAREAGKLIPVIEMESVWQAMVISARAELLAMGTKLRADLRQSFNIEVPPEMIETYIYASLEHLANTDETDADAPDRESEEGLSSAAENLDD